MVDAMKAKADVADLPTKADVAELATKKQQGHLVVRQQHLRDCGRRLHCVPISDEPPERSNQGLESMQLRSSGPEACSKADRVALWGGGRRWGHGEGSKGSGWCTCARYARPCVRGGHLNNFELRTLFS